MFHLRTGNNPTHMVTCSYWACFFNLRNGKVRHSTSTSGYVDIICATNFSCIIIFSYYIGAHSVIYSSFDSTYRRTGWIFYFIVVLASTVSVIPATFINNLSAKRQYPVYWGNGALTFPFRYLYLRWVENDKK